jgi:hypothetical protein
VNPIRYDRKPSGGLLLLLFCWASAAPLGAASPPHIEGDVRIGFRSMMGGGQSRNGVWTPLQATIKAGADDVTLGAFNLVVESTDGEAVPYRYTAPVPAIPANDERLVFVYVRPGSPGCEFTVTLQKTDGQIVQTIARIQRDPSAPKSEVLEARDVLFLTVGSRLHALKQALKHPEKPAKPGEAEEEDDESGTQRFAFIESVDAMPERRFGYESVDVLLLTTSSDSFVNQLLEMDKARRDALLDWVRRGGRLVLSVGRNQQSVARWLDKVPLVDCAIKSKVTRASLPNLSFWCGGEAQQKEPLGQVEIACVTPGANTYGLVWEEAVGGDLEKRPIVLQANCGLGRVLLVAFDLDATPFSTWEGQAAFWKKMQAELAPRPPAARANPAAGQRGESAAELKRVLEDFEDAPVISFGWVALFILFYILLVGPLDYFILKKVFKRLELTWITFPVLVLIVSVAAYATAYYFKGDDLRINKIDLVEIDLRGSGQVYGTSWFTLFSPRIQNYTVGLKPVAPDWGGRWDENDTDAPTPPALLATLDGPEPSLGGNSQSLFRRPYEYAEDAAGLTRVPIPVWATRTFTASWRAPLKDRAALDRPSPIRADLRVSRDGKALTGAVVNNLPAELLGTVLFHRNQWYLLGDLLPGESREVGPLFERDVKPHSLPEWFSDASVLRPRPGSMASGPQRSRMIQSYSSLRSLLFHDAGGDEPPNSGLRGLDAAWRLPPQGEGPQRRFRDEVILVARTPPRIGKAETVALDGVSPTRLWLDHLPGTQAQRPPLSGYLQQETYVRIYIPLVRDPSRER